MDLNKLTSLLLSSDSIQGFSSLTDVADDDVNSVLTAALPALLNGAKDQAKDENTTESFVNALAEHAKDDTSDINGFLGKVDLADGAKIIGHLLGSKKEDVTESVAKKSGVSDDKTAMILSAAAPLLMSLLGQQADEDDNKKDGTAALIGALLENVDLTALLTGASSTETGKKKKSAKKKSSKKKSAEDNGVGGLLGGLMKLLK